MNAREYIEAIHSIATLQQDQAPVFEGIRDLAALALEQLPEGHYIVFLNDEVES